MITAELQLSKEQYERQIAIAPSYYIVYGDGARLFIGLKSIAHDKSTAEYYWLCTWDDNAARDPASFWTADASKQELYDFVLQKTKNIDQRFKEIFSLTKPEGILQPGIVLRDLEPGDIPSGHVTLLGDAVHPMTPCKFTSSTCVLCCKLTKASSG